MAHVVFFLGIRRRKRRRSYPSVLAGQAGHVKPTVGGWSLALPCRHQGSGLPKQPGLGLGAGPGLHGAGAEAVGL